MTSSSNAPPSSTELAPPGPVWLASDIHLGEHNPLTAAAFYRFLAQARAQAGALILLGDLFEAWVGDDHATRDPPPWLAQAVDELRRTAAAIPLWIGCGNRDFLMGQRLAALTDARLLPDEAILHTAGTCVLLAHGDQYCTDDAAYQRMRRLVRAPWLQRAFLSLPLGLRRRIAAWARARSRRARTGKSPTIMDVNQQAVQAAMDAHGCRLLVHGHTHRPARHRWTLAGELHERIVLPDWDCDQGQARGGWLEIDAAGPRLIGEPSSARAACGGGH